MIRSPFNYAAQGPAAQPVSASWQRVVGGSVTPDVAGGEILTEAGDAVLLDDGASDLLKEAGTRPIGGDILTEDDGRVLLEDGSSRLLDEAGAPAVPVQVGDILTEAGDPILLDDGSSILLAESGVRAVDPTIPVLTIPYSSGLFSTFAATVGPLTPGQLYRVTVVAFNAPGDSDAASTTVRAIAVGPGRAVDLTGTVTA